MYVFVSFQPRGQWTVTCVWVFLLTPPSSAIFPALWSVRCPPGAHGGPAPLKTAKISPQRKVSKILAWTIGPLHLLQFCLEISHFVHLTKTEQINKTASFIVNHMNCVREPFQHIIHTAPPLTSICAISIRPINLSQPAGAEDSLSPRFMNQAHCRGNNKQKETMKKKTCHEKDRNKWRVRCLQTDKHKLQMVFRRNRIC